MKTHRTERIILFLLYRLGIRSSIPAKIINSITIEECGDPMVDLRRASFLSFYDHLNERKEVLARKSVYDKLELAASLLPSAYHLKIHSAYRPRTEQITLWNRKYNEMKSQFPDLPDEEIAILTKRVCADPRFGFGGHQTGGAVDITLCDDNGTDYDMGCIISDSDTSKLPTCSQAISKEAHDNRVILLSAMTKAGFVNYPKEWWHYCYGDRMWAAYKNKKVAIYDEVLPQESGLNAAQSQ